MKKSAVEIIPAGIDSLIVEVREQKVILDADLARVYGVPTRVLNQAVKRNATRFPPDFVFRLLPGELRAMRSQVVTASSEAVAAASSKRKAMTGKARKTWAGQHLASPYCSRTR